MLYTSTIESNKYGFRVDSGNLNAQFYGENLEDFGGVFNISASNEYNIDETYQINGTFKTLNENSIIQRTYSNTFTGNTLGYMFGEYSDLESNSFDVYGNIFEEEYDVLDYFNLYNFENPIAGGYKGIIGSVFYVNEEVSYVQVDNMGEFFTLNNISQGYMTSDKIGYVGSSSSYSTLPNNGFLRYNYLENINIYKDGPWNMTTFNTGLDKARINLSNKNLMLTDGLHYYEPAFSTAIGKVVNYNGEALIEGKIYTLGDILNTDEYMDFT